MKKPLAISHSQTTVHPPTGVESSQIDFLWKQHAYISDFVKLADSKAAFISIAATALLGSQLSYLISHPSSMLVVFTHAFDYCVAVGSFLCLLGAIVLTVLAVIPRLSREPRPGPLSWVEVAEFESATAFTATSISVTARQAVELMAKQIWHMARICKKKNTLVWWSIIVGLCGGFLFMVLMARLVFFEI